MTNPAALVSKLWNYCSILRDDSLSLGDYVEQLTFLLFLKMADEQSWLRGTPSAIPKGKDWPSLLAKEAMNWRCITATRWRAWASAPGCWA